MSDRYLFTPLDAKTGIRHNYYVSREDVRQLRRGPGHTATLTDLDSGKRITVHSAPCGADCYCDAHITRIEEAA